MKVENFEKKASNKSPDFHEDYNRLIEDYISLKSEWITILQTGELTKYKKYTTSFVLVIAMAPCQVKYINVIFVWVDAITKGR